MARTNNLTNFLTDVSSAIKQKTGDNTPIPASDFDTEILSIETAGNYQSKTLNVTQNGNYNLLPDQDYDAMSNVNISVNVPTGEDLETEISAQEEYIAQLEAIIDTKAAGSGDGSSMNIFVQETEPEVKKGIWLKKDAEPDYYTFDKNVYTGGEWAPDGQYADIPYPYGNGGIGCVGTDIYVFGSNDSTYYKYAYKYNTLNNTWMRISDIPISYNTAASVRSATVGTDIYLFGGTGSSSAVRIAYKYDTLTDTYTRLTDIPMDFVGGTVTAVGTDIYLICGIFAYDSSSSKKVYKYNTLTDTYTQLSNIPIDVHYGSSEKLNEFIYIFGGYSNPTITYKYDTTRDTYTQLSNIPYDFQYGATARIGTDIYLFGSSVNSYKQYAYKYDTLTDTYTQLTNAPYNADYSRAVVIDTNIYLFKTTMVKVYSLQSKTFQQDNLVVVGQGHNNGVGYETELFSNNKNITAPLYVFTDAWYYTLQGGLETDIPSYYGDGTQWINFKNPPVEEVEE